MSLFRFKYIIFLLVLLSSCTYLKKATTFYSKVPKNKPYLIENKIVRVDWKFDKQEADAVEQRLKNQLEDSSKEKAPKEILGLKFIKNPVVYDTGYSSISAKNMQGSMYHLGYYNSSVHFSQDTVGKKKNQIIAKYSVTAGKPTLIDTVSYRLKIPELQSIAINSRNEALLVKNNPVTKTAVLSEISRLVDSFRNNGYYKFTSAELRVRGDSSIAALTDISDDPFEQLEALNEAQKKRDSPTVKLAFVIIKPEDSTKLNRYLINKIYVLSDFRAGDNFVKSSKLTELKTKNLILRYHQYLFRASLLERNITMHPGDVYKQDEYYKTLNNLSRVGVWQSVNIRIIDNFDEPDKIDLIIELLPAKKFSNVNSLDLSYSTGNAKNALGGNLLGLSLNFLLENKNIGKEAIRMTHNFRAGIELNNKNKGNTNNVINSNEISYSNNIIFPKLIWPFQNTFIKRKLKSGESFLNTNFSYSNRLDFFNLQSVNLGFGYSFTTKKNHKIIFRPLNAEFGYLYNQTDTFNTILNSNPFLRYSYNTAFVLGVAGSYSSFKKYTSSNTNVTKEGALKINAEESGILNLVPILTNYKKKYIKLDVEYKYTVSHKKTAHIFRGFLGLGVPIWGDSALPFFKQFYGGGSNSMRGWPIRGIGRGSQPLTPFVQGQTTFNDRTGDMQLEFNYEFRHDITPIFSWLKLKGAIFFDAGNVWNIKRSTPIGIEDETQFKFKNFAKQVGMDVGYGLRFDATYLVFRTDFGFRIKRPETSDINNGWKKPDISFDDVFQKILSKEYRQWRYENFNFTFGINYPF
jgi:outer membrane protein insertion porin family